MTTRRFAAMFLLVAGVAGVAGAAAAQDHGPHVVPQVPASLLERPLPLREGIGSAHDAVGTTVSDAQRYYDQGLNYLHGYVWIEAARSFHQALRLDARLTLAQVGLSIAYTELNQPDRAEQALQRASELSTGASAHDRLHVRARVAQAAAERSPADVSRLAAYRQVLDAALVAEPGDAELWMLRGIAESSDPADRGQGSPVSAMPFLERAVALGATAAEHYLTHALENAGRIAEALRHAEAYRSAAPAVPHAVHMHGHVLRRVGRIQDAVAAFEAAERIESAYLTREQIPPEYDWHREHNLDLLGLSYRYLGQMRAAETRMREAFALPSSLLVQMVNKRTWPEFLIARGRYDEAVAAAEQLVANEAGVVRATGHIEAGLALLAAGRVAPAVERSNLALRELRAAPGGQAVVSPALEQLQGLLYLRTPQRERGRAMLVALSRRLRALPGPDNWVQALFTLEATAQGARAADDWALAETIARDMLAHDPAYGGTHEALALVLAHKGDTAGAARERALAARAWSAADPGVRSRITTDLPASSRP